MKVFPRIEFELYLWGREKGETFVELWGTEL